MKYSSFHIEYANKRHQEIVLLAVLRLGTAKSIEISNFINREIGIKMTYRSVQAWLSKLIKEGLIGRNEHKLYFLTESGRDIRHFANHVGELNLKHLFLLPMPGSEEKKIDELIHRIGFLAVWQFISLPSVEPGSEPDAVRDSFNVSWVSNSIPTRAMFDQFSKAFGYEVHGNKFYRYAVTRQQLDELLFTLYASTRYSVYFEAMMHAYLEAMNERILEIRIEGQKIMKKISRDIILHGNNT